jgi:hypothetical protein
LLYKQWFGSAECEWMTNQKANLSSLQDSSTGSGKETTVCVVCCTTGSSMPETVTALVTAFSRDVAVRRRILMETEGLLLTGEEIDVLVVPSGTKLSKLRLLADTEEDLVCICDPDLLIEPKGCREVLRVALEVASEHNEVVVFGIVNGHDNGTMLSKVVGLDKWLSHRVLRPSLWATHIGITLPGQFLIISRGLLRCLQGEVDSYLDDLYMGLIVKERGVHVVRVPVVVGREEPRNCWGSLLTQRIRWMKGLKSLIWGFSVRPSAVALLLVHYLVYYGLPILVGLGIWLLAMNNPLVAAILFFALAAFLAMLTRRAMSTACCYLAVFPCLLLAVSLLCWLPLNESLLRRR